MKLLSNFGEFDSKTFFSDELYGLTAVLTVLANSKSGERYCYNRVFFLFRGEYRPPFVLKKWNIPSKAEFANTDSVDSKANGILSFSVIFRDQKAVYC